MKLRPAFALFLVLVPLCWLASAALPGAQDAAGLIAEIKKNRDESDPKLIQQLAALKTRDAMTGLIDLYDTGLSSVYMKREVVKSLGSFDNVADCEQPALQKLTDVATLAKETELREIAIDTLGTCNHMGKHFLKTIVDSTAEPAIREQAMEKVVRMATKEDKDFFERMFKTAEGDKASKKEEKAREAKAKKDKDKDGEGGEKRVYPLTHVREMAFEQLAPDMSADKVAEYAREKEKDASDVEKWGIRRLALLELERRKEKNLGEIAKQVYGDVAEKGSNRAEAARILADLEGTKILAQFLEDGRGAEATTPEEMRMVMADFVAKSRDDATDQKLIKLVGKGKWHEQRFVLRALNGCKDPKLAKALAKSAQEAAKLVPPKSVDKDYERGRDLAVMTVELIASLGDKETLPELQALVQGAQDERVVSAAMDAVGEISGKDATWLQAVEGYAANPKIEIRNAALQQLGKSGDAKYVAVLSKAIADPEWSTRLAALDGLAAMRSAEALPAIIAQMEKESGLMLIRFADVLWGLTGKPFRTSPSAWKTWWEKEGSGFKPISQAELSKLETQEEERRLKQTTGTATFFGIRIVSHRVIFIIDISGSMQELLESEYVGKQGKPRIDVAKSELVKCIDALDKDCLFNIITFSSGVEHWLETGVAEFSKSNKDAAKKYVEALGANGGTNLYGAVKDAFADVDVDTIYILSDGEPSVGDETDQYVIRERVKEWNEHRGIVIHTIAVGGTFQILEWLAQDTGGTHKKFQ